MKNFKSLIIEMSIIRRNTRRETNLRLTVRANMSIWITVSLWISKHAEETKGRQN